MKRDPIIASQKMNRKQILAAIDALHTKRWKREQADLRQDIDPAAPHYAPAVSREAVQP